MPHDNHYRAAHCGRLALALALLFGGAAMAGDFSQAMLKEQYDRITPAIAFITYSFDVTNPSNGETRKQDGTALALLVSEDGLMMTHGHLVREGVQPFQLSAKVGRGDQEQRYDVTLLQKPDDVNVAFLKIKSDKPVKFPFVTLAAPSNLGLGQEVAIFGLSGETLDFTPSVLVSRIAATLDKPRPTFSLVEAIRFGYVGGPVVDAQGRIVGVVGYDLSGVEGGDLYTRSGQPLVYQSELLQKHIANPPGEKKNDSGKEEAWLGIFTQPLSDDLADYWKLPQRGGLVVSSVVPGSPAASGDIKVGDIITEYDGVPMRAKADQDVLSFSRLIRESAPQKAVVIKLLRGGEPKEVQATLGARPRSSKQADEFVEPVLGLTVRELTQDLRIQLNLPETVQGVIVRSVKSGSVAQRGRMAPGVVILSLGDHPTTNLDEFKAAVAKLAEAKPKELVVSGQMGSARGFFRLEPVWQE